MNTRWTGTLEFGLVTIPFKISTKTLQPGADSTNMQNGNVIQIVDFLSRDRINESQFESNLQLEPDKEGAHAFNLLQDGLVKNNKVALGSFNGYDNNYICLLHAEDEGMCVELVDTFTEDETLEDNLARHGMMGAEAEAKRLSPFGQVKKFFSMQSLKFF